MPYIIDWLTRWVIFTFMLLLPLSLPDFSLMFLLGVSGCTGSGTTEARKCGYYGV